jgi:hypothetical protein
LGQKQTNGPGPKSGFVRFSNRCVPKTSSALISRTNRLTSAHHDRAGVFRNGRLASPWQNGFAERLIGSIRRECVDHFVVGRSTSAPNAAILGSLLQRHQNLSVIEHRWASFSPGAADRKNQIAPHPWRSSSPRADLGFRHTQRAGLGFRHTQRAGLGFRYTQHELPVGGFRNLGVVKLHRIAPNRQKVKVVTFLQRGGEFVERHPEIDRRLVDATNG